MTCTFHGTKDVSRYGRTMFTAHTVFYFKKDTRRYH
jgi:hypothetical protein